MKATVKRYKRGWYHVIFRTPSHPLGAVGFKVIGADKQWQLFNHFDTELNCWTSKVSMIEYLEGKTESQLIELSDKRHA